MRSMMDAFGIFDNEELWGLMMHLVSISDSIADIPVFDQVHVIDVERWWFICFLQFSF